MKGKRTIKPHPTKYQILSPCGQDIRGIEDTLELARQRIAGTGLVIQHPVASYATLPPLQESADKERKTKVFRI